ncbi:uncharacterized protein LOC125228387 [Leguminivora glycinivorella]|uniref:uncharacterized protein LOC125228387 n=1 Tax=Leguminivora glycinivorella TaxID=1035111 RepID=UPI002010A4AB|nr:uncharacterized protein LOC125228387 [Leguminivora glycinivorella]
MIKLIVLLFVTVIVFANARHIHPHGDTHARHHDVELCKDGTEKDGEAAEIREYVEVIEKIPRNVKPNRFVPRNDPIFFMGHMPCPEEGFKRDYLGICREVWD